MPAAPESWRRRPAHRSLGEGGFFDIKLRERELSQLAAAPSCIRPREASGARCFSVAFRPAGTSELARQDHHANPGSSNLLTPPPPCGCHGLRVSGCPPNCFRGRHRSYSDLIRPIKDPFPPPGYWPVCRVPFGRLLRPFSAITAYLHLFAHFPRKKKIVFF
jgi:hypothetical protein